MNMKRISSYSLFSLLLLFFSYTHVSAGIRPSFDLETCAWNATDIVVVTEGKKIDGVFRILETWKGDINPGDTIKIPELASFQSESSRVVSNAWYQTEKTSRLVVTGDRMILFLKRDSQAAARQMEDGAPLPAASIKWKSANFFDDMNVSVVWIEREQAYGFVQLVNPGPSLLTRVAASEDEFKNQVLAIRATRTSFLRAAEISDPGRRAEALLPFVRHSLYQAQDAAFAELIKTGPAALPFLRQLLADDSLLDIHSNLVQVLAEAGKNDAGPDLFGLVTKDLEFWKKTAPLLKTGWWNGNGLGSLEDAEPLRHTYGRDYEAIGRLKKRPYPEARVLLTEFRDFWRSLQQLEEVGLDQMTKTCDEALAELDRLKASRNAIRFEGLHTFGDSSLLKALREAGISTDDPAPFTPDLADKAKTAIQDYLASQGYRHAAILAETDTRSQALNFVIDEGKRVGIGEIRFEGNKVFSSEQLASQMKQCLADDDVGGYDPDIFENCLSRPHHFVRSKGYLQAKFADPLKKETEDGLVLTISADEGLLYRLGRITISGATFISPEQIRATTPLQKGDIADGEKIGKALYEDLKKQYGNNGYIQYTAEAFPTFRKNPRHPNEGIVDFEVTIDEGKQFRLRSIKLLGTEFPRKKLRDMLLIRDGDVFNQQLYDDWVVKLNESDLLDSIDWSRDAAFTTDEEHGLLDIVVQLNRNRIEGKPADGSTQKFSNFPLPLYER
jgi:Surface antigen variable number repeat